MNKNWIHKKETENTVIYERQVEGLYQSVELEKSLIVEIIKDYEKI